MNGNITFEGFIFLVAVSSSLLTLLACFKRPIALRWISALLVPLMIAYTVYWFPVWRSRGENRFAYHSFELLFVGGAYIAGLICSLLVVLIVHLVRKPWRNSATQSPQTMTKGTNMIQITNAKFRIIFTLNCLVIAAALGLSFFLSSHKLNSSRGVTHEQWSSKVDASTNTKAMKELLEADDSYIRVLEQIVNNYHKQMSFALVLISLLPVAILGILVSSRFRPAK